jgi:DNA polymerase elongation subunit (family B)
MLVQHVLLMYSNLHTIHALLPFSYLQKAKKVAANSSYGLLGATKGYLPLPDLAAVTTLTGRQALMFSKHIAESKYGARVVAGDTDSIMCILPAHETATPIGSSDYKAERMQYVFKQAEIIGRDISDQLPAELDFELEGVMYPSCFYKKKTYCAVMWERPEAPQPSLKMKGVVAIRNDWSRLTKALATDVLRMAVQDGNPDAAVAHLRATLAKMRAGELPVEDFIISKELHSLEPKTMSPHVAVCLRIRERDPSAVPALGTKIQYVICRDSSSSSSSSSSGVSAKARLPEEASPGDIDYTFYFEKQLLKPLSELMGPLIDGGAVKLRRLLTNENLGQAEITSMFKRKESSHVSDTIEVKRQKADDVQSKPQHKQQNIMTMFGGGNVIEQQSKQQVKKKAVTIITGQTQYIGDDFASKNV